MKSNLSGLALAWGLTLALLGAVETGSASAPSAATEAPKDEFKLRDVRWQLMPDSVKQVFVGPDDRVWCVTSNPLDVVPAAASKAAIEREFAKPMPVLTGVRPALFEPGGRVWFIGEGGAALWGYDGKTWIERRQGDDRPFRFVGNCPGHGRQSGYGYNLLMGEKRFFIDTGGVQVFDGREWSVLSADVVEKGPATRPAAVAPQGPFGPPPPGGTITIQGPAVIIMGGGVPASQPAGAVAADQGRTRITCLFAERDGQGALVMCSATSRVWRYRDGVWKQATLPTAMGGARRDTRLAYIAPAELGMFYAAIGYMDNYRGAALLKVSLSEPAQVDAAVFERIVSRLGDENFNVREKASEDLIALGAPAERLIRAAIQKTTDEEVRNRLELALKRAVSPPEELSELGGVQLGRVGFMQYLDDRTMIIQTAIDSEMRGAGRNQPWIVIIDPSGKGRQIQGMLISRSSDTDGTGLVGWDGKTFWVPSGSGGGQLATRISPSDGRIVEVFGDANFGWVHAVKKDGTAFAGRVDPSARVYGAGSGGMWGPIVAWRAAATDDRSVLKATAIGAVERSWAVASDGAIWSLTSRRGIERTDASGTQIMTGPERIFPVGVFVPGKDGAMLFVGESSTGIILFKDGKTVNERDVATMIKNHREELVAALSGVVPTVNRRDSMSSRKLVVDKKGMIWSSERDGRITVNADGLDLDVAKVITDAGKIGRFQTRVEELTPVGNGGRVLMRSISGETIFAWIENGAVKIADGPRDSRLTVSDSDGGLWVSSMEPDADTGKPAPIARWYTEKGITGEYLNRGWALAADSDGGVWLGGGSAEGSPRVTYWRKGRLIGGVDLDIAVGGQSAPVLFSDRPGSLYVFTVTGLRHYVAPDPGQPQKLAYEKTYYIVGPDGVTISALPGSTISDIKLTPSGQLVMTAMVMEGQTVTMKLLSVPFPGDRAAGEKTK